MLDQFYTGNLEDTSKEDPLAEILKVKAQHDNLGGAGNVAVNIKTMDSNPFLIGVIGDDVSGKRIKTLCQKNKITQEGIFIDDTRTSTVKTRLYNRDQIIRFDIEDTHDISIIIENKIIAHLNKLIVINEINGIILQDYNKGVLTKSSIKRILAIANNNNIPLFVDPKKDNFFEYYRVAVFKPNLREINWAIPNLSYSEAAKTIISKSKCEIAAITLSEDGIYMSTNYETNLSPSLANGIIDVCGAGDTVISILTLTYLSKCNISLMALLANLAAADVCNSKGVVPVEFENLVRLYFSHSHNI